MPPMSYDPESHLLLVPADPGARERTARLREWGVGEHPVPELDAFAAELASRLAAPCALVNLPREDHQYFAGLYVSGAPSAPALVSRWLPRGHGYCPHVIARRKALALEDVRDYPRFAGNPAVDDLGLRSYLGAPVTDGDGLVLGTVCVLDGEPRHRGREGLRIIKEAAGEPAVVLRNRAYGGL